MSKGYTAERLIEFGGVVAKFEQLMARELADTFRIYGTAWQAEVRALRERIAALETEREQLDAAIDGLINDLQHADQIRRMYT